MWEFSFVLRDIPKGKERPRLSKKTNKVYTPIDTVKCERLVKQLASSAMEEKNLIISVASIEVEIIVVYKRPKNNKQIYSQKFPDIDNLTKTVLDSMNMVAYIDDKQVASLNVKKVYTQMYLELDDYTVIKVRELEI